MRDFFEGLHKVHFVGVGGVSMSKLCAYTRHMGIECTGSDIKYSPILDRLAELGVKIAIGDGSKWARESDLVVYSSAISANTPDLKVARHICERKYYLAKVAERFASVIAISGTHGKTTVSSMLAWVLRTAGVELTAHIGGDVVGVDNLDWIDGEQCFVTEACEYSRSFLELKPDIGVVLNVDYDHPDCYKDLEDTYLAFRDFAKKSRVVIYNSRYDIRPKLESTNNKYISFGAEESADYALHDIEIENGELRFEVDYQGESLGDFVIYSYNDINILCGLAVVAVAHQYGVDMDIVRLALATFPGVKDRFECLGRIKSGAKLITDYAHHPREITTVISTAKRLAQGRVVTIFEPHTFSRTKALMDDFVNALAKSDEVVLMPTYKARDIAIQGEDSMALYRELSRVMDIVVYRDGYAEVKEYINKNTTSEDIVLAVGAGLDASRFMD